MHISKIVPLRTRAKVAPNTDHPSHRIHCLVFGAVRTRLDNGSTVLVTDDNKHVSNNCEIRPVACVWWHFDENLTLIVLGFFLAIVFSSHTVSSPSSFVCADVALPFFYQLRFLTPFCRFSLMLFYRCLVSIDIIIIIIMFFLNYNSHVPL